MTYCITCWQLFDSVKSGKLNMRSEIISLSMFVPSQGHRLLLLIWISGLPEPNRTDKGKDSTVSFLFYNRGCWKPHRVGRTLNLYIMANYYCEYCGAKYSNLSSLTTCSCPKHPNGPNRGKHKLYEGSEKSKYTCKYCGLQYSSLATLTTCSCPRHPNGSNRGKHAPALWE